MSSTDNLENQAMTGVCAPSCCILLVDDDPCATMSRKAILEMSLPCTVRTAPQAWAALGEIASSSFDLIIVDYHMPEMNGLQLALLIREKWPMLPIMMLSGDSAVPNEAKGAVDEFVEKGWPPEVFIATVLQVLTNCK